MDTLNVLPGSCFLLPSIPPKNIKEENLSVSSSSSLISPLLSVILSLGCRSLEEKKKDRRQEVESDSGTFPTVCMWGVGWGEEASRDST